MKPRGLLYGAARACKAQQIPDDGLAVPRVLLDDPQVLPPLRFRGFATQQQLSVSQNHAQGVVDFVGDSRSELADGGELVGLE